MNIQKIISLGKSHWGIFVIFTTAIFLYTFRLNSLPYAFHGDEGETATQALRVIQSNFPVIGTGWFDLPIASFIPHAITMIIFGKSQFGDRMGSVLFSLGMLPLFYIFLLRLYNKYIAVTSTILLATSHMWIALSRLGITYVQATFLLLGCLVFIQQGFLSKKRSFFYLAIAGIFCGLCFYSYYAARITPVIALPFFLLFFRKLSWRSWALSLFVFIVTALLVFLPQGIFYLHHPGAFSSRTNTVYIFSPSGRDWTKGDYKGKNDMQILALQFLKSVNPFPGDNSGQYGLRGQLVDYLTIGLFVVGLSVLILKRTAISFFIFFWFFITVTIGQTLTTILSPIFLPRLVVGLPAFFTLCALGLYAITMSTEKLLNKKFTSYIISIIILLLIVITNLHIYFVAYPQQQLNHIAGDPQALIATKISLYLNRLPTSYQAVFLTAPYLNIPYGPFDFLAAKRIKIPIDNPKDYPIPQFLTKTIFFIYPQYQQRLSDLHATYPEGKETIIKNPAGDVEYYMFVVN